MRVAQTCSERDAVNHKSKRRSSRFTFVDLPTLFTTSWLASASGQSKVCLETIDGGHRLTRNGEPYFIRGVGGDSHLAQLAAAGGNSIRTWSTDNLDAILDEAHKHNLTVCVGFWMGHERHGFDYQDEAAVVKQLDDCTAAVREYKDHPAVLMWGIGNEMEGDGTNPAIWYAVDHIARECKRIDPNHPTMTVIADLGESKVQNIERFCPNIDIIGVNSYGGISSLAERYRATGGTKPYVVTEFGPLGPWEVGKTEWGIADRSDQHGQRQDLRRRLSQGRGRAEGPVPGSYAFLWGQKQETTATWFGMLLPDGSRLAAVDAMTEAWTGSPPNNRCPRIESLVADRTQQAETGRDDQSQVRGQRSRERSAVDQVGVAIRLGNHRRRRRLPVDESSFADAVSQSTGPKRPSRSLPGAAAIGCSRTFTTARAVRRWPTFPCMWTRRSFPRRHPRRSCRSCSTPTA